MKATLTMSETGYYKQTAEQVDAEMDQVKAAQRDPRNFEPLYTRYYSRIVAYVYHRIESKEEAFEITAQVFYKALENLHSYKTLGVPFSAWLFRIASNEMNIRFRKNRSGRLVTLDNEGLAELRMSIEESANEQKDKELFDALHQLEKEEMDLIDMRYFEKRPFKEIAEILEINESACKIRVYRIIEKLRHTIKK